MKLILVTTLFLLCGCSAGFQFQPTQPVSRAEVGEAFAAQQKQLDGIKKALTEIAMLVEPKKAKK